MKGSEGKGEAVLGVGIQGWNLKSCHRSGRHGHSDWIVVATFSENEKTGEDCGKEEKSYVRRVRWTLRNFQVDRCVRSLAPWCQRG